MMVMGWLLSLGRMPFSVGFVRNLWWRFLCLPGTSHAYHWAACRPCLISRSLFWAFPALQRSSNPAGSALGAASDWLARAAVQVMGWLQCIGTPTPTPCSNKTAAKFENLEGGGSTHMMMSNTKSTPPTALRELAAGSPRGTPTGDSSAGRAQLLQKLLQRQSRPTTPGSATGPGPALPLEGSPLSPNFRSPRLQAMHMEGEALPSPNFNLQTATNQMEEDEFQMLLTGLMGDGAAPLPSPMNPMNILSPRRSPRLASHAMMPLG
ncbi:hypothetical protein CYMTET_53196 [Cymbomonas tetramitiformis]|uniref:Uncharacterized protein n=1 Tax=Cymbomonas tetramitiformis TaxID=36881 RepID=A0AAE0EQL0_9CHLO|nr:hypothetical protein CYMTET_53196 [Cymbomonas tetramitiformis]